MSSLLTPSIERPTRVRFGVLGFACSLSLITYLDRICIMRASADIRNDLGFSLDEMGLVFSAFTLGYTLFEVPGGWMGDRWGSRRILLRIVLWWSLFTALTGSVRSLALDTGLSVSWLPSGRLVISSLGLMLAVRFLFGVGEAGAYPNLTRITRGWFPIRERGFAQGTIWMAARLGGAFAPFIIGRLSSAIGWRLAFVALGGVGIVWAIVFHRWFRDRPASHPGCNLAEQMLIEPDQAARLERDGDHAWPGFRLLAGTLSIWAMCFSSFWVCFGWYFYITWQPEYLQQVHAFKIDGMLSEVLTGLPFLCGALGSVVGGRLSDRLVGQTGSVRWGRALVGIFGFFGAGICIFFSGRATVAWEAITFLCVAFLINDLAVPVLWTASAEIGGRFAGSVSGLMNMVGGGGAILMPALLPYALKLVPAHFSPQQRWEWIFSGLAGAWFLAGAAWFFIDPSRPLRQDKVVAENNTINQAIRRV